MDEIKLSLHELDLYFQHKEEIELAKLRLENAAKDLEIKQLQMKCFTIQLYRKYGLSDTDKINLETGEITKGSPPDENKPKV